MIIPKSIAVQGLCGFDTKKSVHFYSQLRLTKEAAHRSVLYLFVTSLGAI